MDTYRACSHKTATFFVYQIKILPKKLSVKRTQDRIKNNFHARNTHIFSLKLLLGKIILLSTITFLHLAPPNAQLFPVQKNCTGWNFQSISCSSINTFSCDFTFDGTVWDSKKKAKNVSSLGHAHQCVLQSLKPQHSCYVHCHLHILNTNCHL